MNDNTSDQESRKINWELFIFGLVFSAFSLYISYAIYWSHEKQTDAAANFVSVLSTILDTTVTQTTVRNATTTGNTRTYVPSIHYEYEVDGKTYQSKRYKYLGDGYSNTQDAQSIVDGYPVGSKQTAYYNPNNPSEAVLHKSVPTEMSLMVFIPALFVFVGFLAVFGGWRGWLRGLQKQV
ncbi:MAG: hypothetical protein DHS20C09_22030 [marine bacterium B5-7]|nr:MAG: hypothetical protein DHS20C09_22030 [marine bacterium B5-7]